MPAPLRFRRPMECLEVDRIAEGELWQYELKLDGYRIIAIKQDGEVQLFSRNGNSFNSKVAEIAFNERTPNGHSRHSKFLRLRDSADLRRKPKLVSAMD